MSDFTYTMFIDRCGQPGEIVARGVTSSRALVIALEHGGAGKAEVVHKDVGRLRYFAIGRRLAEDGSFECARHIAMPRSDDLPLDTELAMEAFEQVLLQHPHEFWDGRIVADEAFAGRHVH
ncbi:hypothetical protein [Bradyrhizobium sp. I71]|jgi:hypothetical protein|uniref:hypothetical protein n=1 Tax=Bradyrhizobium sp. I71 TaxID=2590772 RepID=UPI001EF9416C|nr:hypothetical protein [Bradyrhizobium sp. I71]ULL01505.1 hypothetical protein FJV43_17925 [Bradyrhizobium sp. I71]